MSRGHDRERVEGDERAIDFIQKVAAQRRAMCRHEHHAGTCRGAVNLAEEAGKLLASLGVEPRYPQDPFDEPCALCGDAEYVIGQVWTRVSVHAKCVDGLPPAREAADDLSRGHDRGERR